MTLQALNNLPLELVQRTGDRQTREYDITSDTSQLFMEFAVVR